MCPPTEETATNGTNGAPISKEGFTGVQTKQNPHPSHRSPYQPVGDFLSNVGRFKIIGAFRKYPPGFTATPIAHATRFRVLRKFDTKKNTPEHS